MTRLDRLWLRGGFPRSFLARSNADSDRWRADFVRTFLERDVPQLGISIPATTLERFWAMLAHYHGQTWNASELARSFGVSHHVTRRYLEALEATYMVRVLRPYFANIGKRQVKSPKVYLRDTGILHHFLGVDSQRALDRHPKLGASWEGLLLEAVIQHLGVRDRQCYFWATHTGAELDLLVEASGKRKGFEFKRTTAPHITKSMRSAIDSLGLTGIDVIHAGDETYPLSKRIRAVAAKRLLDDITD
jgi:predicted AAA+ superfamily ATPase